MNVKYSKKKSSFFLNKNVSKLETIFNSTVFLRSFSRIYLQGIYSQNRMNTYTLHRCNNGTLLATFKDCLMLLSRNPTWQVVTARVRSTREGTVFTGVCLSTFGRRGTPSGQWGVPPSSQLEGTPSSWWGRGYPHLANGGGTPIRPAGGTTNWPTGRYPPPCLEWMWVPPIRTGWGTPLSGDRAAEQALATQRAVCLLRSSRRTFLFSFKKNRQIIWVCCCFQ